MFGTADDGTLAAQLVETPEGLAEALAIAVGTVRMEALASSAQRGGDPLLASRLWHAARFPAARGLVTELARHEPRRARRPLRRPPIWPPLARMMIDMRRRLVKPLAHVSSWR